MSTFTFVGKVVTGYARGGPSVTQTKIQKEG